MLLAQAAIRQLKGEAKSECKIHVANQVLVAVHIFLGLGQREDGF